MQIHSNRISWLTNPALVIYTKKVLDFVQLVLNKHKNNQLFQFAANKVLEAFELNIKRGDL